MHRGYIKLWRKIIDESFLIERRPLTRFEAWIMILLRVSHKKSEVLIKNTIYKINPGQSVKSVETWSDIFRWNRGKTRSFFELLKKVGKIDLQTDNRTTILTVCKWWNYQGDTTSNTASKEYNSEPAENQQRTTEKNEKNERSKTIPPTSPPLSGKTYPDWFYDFKTYQLEFVNAFKNATGDKDWIADIQKQRPGWDVVEMLRESNRWLYEERGWENKKKAARKSSSKYGYKINWKSTFRDCLNRFKGKVIYSKGYWDNKNQSNDQDGWTPPYHEEA